MWLVLMGRHMLQVPIFNAHMSAALRGSDTAAADLAATNSTVIGESNTLVGGVCNST